MHSTLGQRALGTLAKKLHPQLPLTPRESQQLLNLLTSSFRSHLDAAHPVHTTEKSHQSVVRKTVDGGDKDYVSFHARSSSALASQHIDAVLSNPLFAVKPTRRGAASAASELLQDPVAWFVNEIAAGNATLAKASMCLEMLDRRTAAQTAHPNEGKPPGAIIGDWLYFSGLDSSKEFVEMCIAKTQTKRRSNNFIARLVPLLMADGKTSLLWRWFERSWIYTVGPDKELSFRRQLLKHMTQFEVSRDLYRGLVLFRTACDTSIEKHDVKYYERLKPAGQYLVQAIMARPTDTVNQNLYDSFRRSVPHWTSTHSRWAEAVDAMLCLHHPAAVSALPGLQFIQDPAGAATFATASPAVRRFIVQLSLGVARQLLNEESYGDAQVVMAFAKQHFPDLVLSNQPASRKVIVDGQTNKISKARREEERNLELLDSLALT